MVQTNLKAYESYGDKIEWQEDSDRDESFVYFDEPGATIEGIIVKNPQFAGDTYILELPTKERKYLPELQILTKKLANKQVGDIVKIEFLGKKKSKNGNEYNDFRVYTGKHKNTS